MKNCPNCGNPVQDHDRFCTNCGTPLNPEQEKPAAEIADEDYTAPKQPVPPEMPEDDSDRDSDFEPVEPFVQPSTNPAPVKKKHTGLIIGCIIGVLLICGIAVLVIPQFIFVNMSKDIETADSVFGGNHSDLDNYLYQAKHTCSGEMDGMDITFELTAPSEDADLEKMIMNVYMPASYFGMDSMDELIDQLGDNAVSTFTDAVVKQLDLEGAEVKADLESDGLSITLNLDTKNARKYLHLDSDFDLSLSNLVSRINSAGIATCD